MDEANLAYVVVPRRFRVLGVDLLPLRLGHRLLLDRLESPFIYGGRCQLQDLMAAVLACSNTFDEGTKLYRSFLLPLKIRLWGMKLRRYDLAVEIQTMREYIAAGTSCPALKPENGNRAPGGPFLLRLVEFLRAVKNLPDSQCWEYSMAMAQWEWAAYHENRGALKIKNADEISFDAECARLDALADAGNQN